MMLVFVFFAALAVTSQAIVCPHNACDGVVQPVLDCKGEIRTGAGFCGCYDECYRVKDESCNPFTNVHAMGVPIHNLCEKDLECKPRILEGTYTGHFCTDGDLRVSKKEVRPSCMTPCEQKTKACFFSFIRYEGQWFSNCDANRNFLPVQCDNQNLCFCVDTLTGKILTDRVHGTPNC